MKTNEIINQITSLELNIAYLDKPDFREFHGLSEEDVVNIKEELTKQVAANRAEAEEKINFVLGQRRKKQGYIAANNEEILALMKSNDSHQAEIRKLDTYLMYILSALGSDSKHKVSVQNGVIYLGTKRAKTIIDEDKLPHEMFRLKNFALTLDPVADQEKLKGIVSENITASVVINVASLSQEEEKKLIQSFASPALKEFFQAITPLFTKEQNLLSEVEKQALKNYQKQVDQLKYQIESKAKNFMKAGATNAPITAILKYLDSESLGGQTLTDLLEKPKSWSFAEIHQEGKGQVLHFQGKIDGNPLTFYYNLSDTNASLECDDCLYQDPVSKSFTLGKSTGARTKLNIQMPTTEQLASNLSNACSPEQFQKILKNSSTPAEYQQQLSQLISWTIEKSFADEKLIKSRLARHTEKNLTIQTLNSSLIPNEIMEQLTSWKKLNENQDTKRLFKLLDRTTESSTSSELQSFRSALKKRDTLLQSPERIQNIQDPVLRSCLENCATAKIKKSDFPAWNEALLQLFDLFTKQSIWSEASNTDDPNYVLNLSDFSHFVDYLEKPEKKITDDQQLSSFSPDFQRKYEAQKEKSDLQEDKTLASLEEQMKESFEFAYA